MTFCFAERGKPQWDRKRVSRPGYKWHCKSEVDFGVTEGRYRRLDIAADIQGYQN